MVNSVSSLVLALPDELRERLEQGSKDLVDKVQSRESVLIGQITQFISMRVEELTHFAEHLLEQQSHDQLLKEKMRNDAEAALKRPPLKSVLKRRPSTGDKHVTFSEDPPQVEQIDNSSEFEDDNTNIADVGVTTTDDPVDLSGNAVVLFQQKDGMDEMKAGRDFNFSFRSLPINASQDDIQTPPAEPIEVGPLTTGDASSWSNTSGRIRTSVDPRIASYGSNDKPNVSQFTPSTTKPAEVARVDPEPGAVDAHDAKTHGNPDDPVFSFDDVMQVHDSRDSDILDSGAETDDHEKSGDHEDLPSTSSSAANITTHHTHSNLKEPTLVGSAPININLPEYMRVKEAGLSSDGGPRAVNANDPKDPLTHNQDISPDPPSEPQALNLNALDPANMSFSQRMAWEDHMHRT